MARTSTALAISRPPASNWKIGGTEKLYALSIIDTRIGGIGVDAPRPLGSPLVTTAAPLANLRSLQGSGSASEFVFRVSPRNMQLEEPAAVVIVPTQGGGHFIEHQGQIYKNVSITGTTGLRPSPAITPNFLKDVLGVSNPLSGPSLDPETGLPVGERTGFDDLISLRNLFRKYWSMKTDGRVAPYTLMVWQNGKEGEFFVVEPLNFKTTRDAKSPYTFEYAITLRTIERLDIKAKAPADSVIKTTGIAQALSMLRDVSAKLRQAFVLSQSVIDATIGLGQRTLTRVYGPVDEVVRGLAGVINTSSGIFAVPRRRVVATAQSALELSESLNNFRAASDSYQQSGTLSRKAIAANQAKKMAWALVKVASVDSLFAEDTTTQTERRKNPYRDPITGAPRTGGDPTNLDNAPIPSGTKQDIVQGGESIRSAARRLLGNTNLWKQLVIVNNLRAPYLSPSGDGKSVLRPGDPILVPAAGSAFPETAVSSDRSALAVQKDALTERLGRDIFLRANQELGAISDFDFQVNARGDIALIEGVDNMKQAVHIKFKTEPGSLPVHPFFGIAAPIGSKLQVRSLIQFQTNALSSLISDTRIEDVVSFQASAEGNVLSVNTTLRIRGADGSFGVSFGVRK